MGSRVRAMIPTGFGINCEAESAHALALAGAQVELGAGQRQSVR